MNIPELNAAEDRLYPSDNKFEIPCLRLDRQPKTGLLLPFAGWGSEARVRKNVATYHFYVDDYRFTAVWKHPQRVLSGGCRELVSRIFPYMILPP